MSSAMDILNHILNNVDPLHEAVDKKIQQRLNTERKIDLFPIVKATEETYEADMLKANATAVECQEKLTGFALAMHALSTRSARTLVEGLQLELAEKVETLLAEFDDITQEGQDQETILAMWVDVAALLGFFAISTASKDQEYQDWLDEIRERVEANHKETGRTGVVSAIWETT
jgi:hypothetical protein